MKTQTLIIPILSLGMLVLSCNLVARQAANKKTSSVAGSNQSTNVNSLPDPKKSGLRLSTFDVNATPPIGNKIAYDSVINTWDLELRAKGIVLLGAGKPIVMCSIDWLCISNEGYDAFRQALADAAGTIPERVVVHTVHQHDAPWCDFTVEEILKRVGLNPKCFESSFQREVIGRLEASVQNSLNHAQPVTHIGLGEAEVYQVASNRRIMGNDNKIRATRYTATPDSALRAAPEGLIDPMLSMVSFWNSDKPIAVLSYYATHPQSYYRTCIPNPDFPGIARFLRQLAVPDALHIHFDGAGGNIGAGKYNDGSHENRLILAERLADGMKRAWEETVREPITADKVIWTVEPVALPPAKYLRKLMTDVNSHTVPINSENAQQIAWLQRCQAGKRIDVTCLSLGRARILHLPGELFVEYQLAAKALRKDLFVAMAAYGDCGPGYIGTTISYEQGGYETEQASSFVAPEVEGVLMKAIHNLIK